MFDIGWPEMAIILIVALIVIGPRDLPRVAKTIGQWVGRGRALAREFQSQLEDMAREAELDEVKREIEKAGRTNLKGSVRKTLQDTIDPEGDLDKAFDPGRKPKRTSGQEASDEPAADKVSGSGEAPTARGPGETANGTTPPSPGGNPVEAPTAPEPGPPVRARAH